MSQLLSPREKRLASITEIRDLLSGRVITTTISISFDARWSWIIDSVAQHYDCDRDDVGCIEGADGKDIFTARGIPVASTEVDPGQTHVWLTPKQFELLPNDLKAGGRFAILREPARETAGAA